MMRQNNMDLESGDRQLSINVIYMESWPGEDLAPFAFQIRQRKIHGRA